MTVWVLLVVLAICQVSLALDNRRLRRRCRSMVYALAREVHQRLYWQQAAAERPPITRIK